MKTAAQMIKELRESFQSDLEYAKLRKHAVNHPNVREGMRLLVMLGKQAERIGNVQTSQFVYADSARLSADITVDTDSLKSDAVCKLLEWVEDHVGQITSSSDYASEYSAIRSFFVSNDLIHLEIIFRLPTDGDACRRVKTGTKLVEQAVYKLECA